MVHTILMNLAKSASASNGSVASAYEAERAARERAERCEKEVRRMRRDTQAAKDSKGVNVQLDLLEDTCELVKEIKTLLGDATVLAIRGEVPVDSETIKRTDLIEANFDAGVDGGRILRELGRLEKLLSDRERDLKFVLSAPSTSDGYRALAIVQTRGNVTEGAKSEEAKHFEAALKEVETERNRSKSSGKKQEREWREGDHDESSRRPRYDRDRYDRQSPSSRPRAPFSNNPRGASPGMGGEAPVCFACGQQGHFARNCTMNRGAEAAGSRP